MKELHLRTPATNPAEECLEACTWCEFACLACAETCLNELQDDQLALCVQLSLDCAEICWTTRKFLADALVIAPHLVREQLDSCALMCAACAAECRRHFATSLQLATCERTCIRCEQLCRHMQLRVAALD